MITALQGQETEMTVLVPIFSDIMHIEALECLELYAVFAHELSVLFS